MGFCSIPSPCPLPAGEGLVRQASRAVAGFPLPQGEGEGEGIGCLGIHVLSGVQLIGLGILGEYVWRTLDAARRRPTYIVEATRNIEDDTPPRR